MVFGVLEEGCQLLGFAQVTRTNAEFAQFEFQLGNFFLVRGFVQTADNGDLMGQEFACHSFVRSHHAAFNQLM